MTSRTLTSPQALQTFLDPFFAEHMGELHIPGATFVLVKNGLFRRFDDDWFSN